MIAKNDSELHPANLPPRCAYLGLHHTSVGAASEKWEADGLGDDTCTRGSRQINNEFRGPELLPVWPYQKNSTGNAFTNS